MIPTHREPTRPGEMLLEEFLNPHGLTQVEAARRMGIPLNRLNEIIHKKRGVSADTALLLAKLLGTSPSFWMNLQATWDVFHAAKRLHLNLDELFDAAATTHSTAVSTDAESSGGFEQSTSVGDSFVGTFQGVSGKNVTIEKAAGDCHYALAA